MHYNILTTVNFPNGGAPANYIRNLAQGISDNNNTVDIIFLKSFIKGYNEDNSEFDKYKYKTFRKYCLFLKVDQHLIS